MSDFLIDPLMRLADAADPVIDAVTQSDRWNDEVFDEKHPDTINMDFHIELTLSVGDLRELRHALEKARKRLKEATDEQGAA